MYPNRKQTTIYSLLLATLVLGAGVASAAEFGFVGARYQGMGGAGVATVNDSYASYWNPAALATAQSYDAAINFGGMASLEGNALKTMDEIQDLLEGDLIDDILDTLDAGGAITPANEANLDELVDLLEALGDDGIGVIGNGSTGLNMRWKRVAVFARGDFQFAVDPSYDDSNIEFVDDDQVDSILNNESGARVRGLGVVESGVGYGHSFFDGLLNVGGNLKYMHGITFSKYVGYQAIEDADLDFGDSKLRKESDNFGLDLGLMSKPFDFLQVGLVARNVNSPKFKTGGDNNDPRPRKNFKLDAQVRTGVAVFPFSNDTLVVAMDFDLTSNKSDLLGGYKSQLWSTGVEWKTPVPVVDLILRAGGYMNLASGDSHAYVFTGGLGLRVWVISLDLAGGASTSSTKVGSGSQKYPTRFNLSAALGVRGKF